ncbi:cytochrome P450 family protein [Fulvivirga sediminis]|uniref:Uncharacterized protein n=1 Tax=Fulvivirga sediminis TaxID=2803949 RepID=A0A937JY55_9BACT|nr:hypothetical protein [Fulvivirga sediminis]MBL3655329.1 hypothetical protein [Fulvivirga sediminis]
MIKSKLLFLILLFAISCAQNGEIKKVAPQEDQTPEVMKDDQSVDYMPFSRMKHNDIVEKLFKEALEHDQELKSLMLRLEEVRDLKFDSLKNYRTYNNNNQDYWRSLTRYADDINDSTMKNDLKKFIDSLKKDQERKASLLDRTVAQLDSVEKKLNDLEVLTKVMVTAPMMENYQRNELPNHKSLQTVKLSLDSLITVMQPYGQIKK